MSGAAVLLLPFLTLFLLQASLREWIRPKDFAKTNSVFGSFAQLVTQDLRTVNTTQEKDDLVAFLTGLDDHFHQPYHLQLIWYCIGRVRNWYLAKEERKKVEKMAVAASSEKTAASGEKTAVADGPDVDGPDGPVAGPDGPVKARLGKRARRNAKRKAKAALARAEKKKKQ